MTQTIDINGQSHKVLNTLSSGPASPIHTYELAGGSYAFSIAGQWFLQRRGQWREAVTVTASEQEGGR